MKNSFLLLNAAVAVLAFATSTAQANLYNGLTPEEKLAIDKGEQVTRTEDVAGSVWPTVVVYQAVKATPDQVAAVMFDYELHQTMFSKDVGGRREGVIRSVPKTPGAVATDIEYTMNFPKVMGVSLPDENYTVHNTLKKADAEGYEVTWAYVKADSIRDCSGSSKFEKLGTGTLIAYTNFINPPKKFESLAKLIKKMAISRVQDTVKQLSGQTLTEIANDPAKLNTQLAVMAKALGQ